MRKVPKLPESLRGVFVSAGAIEFESCLEVLDLMSQSPIDGIVEEVPDDMCDEIRERALRVSNWLRDVANDVSLKQMRA
jgi:hypothetical protein